MSDLTISAPFTLNGAPATGLTLADIDLYLTSQDKASGAQVHIWNGTQHPTAEYGNGMGKYFRILSGADLNTYNYVVRAEYTGTPANVDDTLTEGEVGEDHIGVWDILTTALVTANSIGKKLADWVLGSDNKVLLSADAQTGVTIPTVTTLTNDPTGLTTLLARLTAARAGYLDNLNVGGLVASSAEATAIQNNTRVVRVVPVVIERPDAGTVTYRIELLLYDETGNMEAPDSAPTIALVNQAGTDLSSRLDSTTMALVATGRYRAIYTASVGDTLEQLVWTFSVIEGGATRLYGNASTIVDTSAVDFTATDRTTLGNIYAAVDTEIATLVANVAAVLAAVDAEIADIQARLPATLDGGNMRSSVKAIDAAVVTSIQSGLSTLTAAQVVTAVYAGLMEGRAFEEIIKDIWAQVAGDFVADDAEEPTEIVYEGPNGTTQMTHTLTDTTRTRSE